MELYKVKPGSLIHIREEAKIPPASLPVHKGCILKFLHIDGMYALCINLEGERVYPAAWTQCQVL